MSEPLDEVIMWEIVKVVQVRDGTAVLGWWL